MLSLSSESNTFSKNNQRTVSVLSSRPPSSRTDAYLPADSVYLKIFGLNLRRTVRSSIVLAPEPFQFLSQLRLLLFVQCRKGPVRRPVVNSKEFHDLFRRERIIHRIHTSRGFQFRKALAQTLSYSFFLTPLHRRRH